MKRLAKKVFHQSRRRQTLLSIGSAAGTAAVLYAFYPLVAVAAITTVLIMHEGGHAVAATAAGVPTALPVFVPAGLIAFGMTVMVRSDGLRRVFIFASGPLSGLLAAMALVLLGWYLALISLVRIGLALCFWEAGSLTIGSDGRKLRVALAERRQICST